MSAQPVTFGVYLLCLDRQNRIVFRISEREHLFFLRFFRSPRNLEHSGKLRRAHVEILQLLGRLDFAWQTKLANICKKLAILTTTGGLQGPRRRLRRRHR